jgi:hypothetical protein
MGFRGLTKNDLRGISKIVVKNMEKNFETQTVNINELDKLKEYSMVVRFEDERGSQYTVGLSPLDEGLFDDTSLTQEQIYLNAEIERDRLGRLRYTRVMFINKGDEYPLDKILLAINKLIDAYRVISDEYWLNRINEDDILFTSQTNSEGDSGGFAYRGMIKAKPDINGEKLKSLITLVTGISPIPTFHLLLLDAKRALDEREHALAIIYSITALESVAKQYFKKMALSKGLSKKMFDNTKLFTLITVLMRLILSKDKLPDALIEDFKKANRLRNDIIHEASLEIDRKDSIAAFETVKKLIEVLGSMT